MVSTVELVRHIIILFVFSVIVAVCIFGIIGSAMLWGWTALLVIVLALLCISMAWILSSFNLFMSVFIADMFVSLFTSLSRLEFLLIHATGVPNSR